VSGFGRQVFACPNLAAENWNILENYNIKTDSKFSLSILHFWFETLLKFIFRLNWPLFWPVAGLVWEISFIVKDESCSTGSLADT
jgi:hypothetical protein